MNLSGCEFVDNEEYAREKLDEKYGQSFVVESVVEKNYLEGYYTVLAYSTENPDIMFKAYVDNDGSNISDNYVSKCVFKKIADVVGKNLDNMNGYFYIYCTPLIESTGLSDPDMEVEEYINEFPKEDINVYLHYAPESLDAVNLYNNLQNVFNGIGNLDGMIYLSIVEEKGLNDVQDYLESHDRIYDSYNKMLEPYYKGYIPIKSGKPDCSLDEFIKMVGDN